jgi:REP element-mobilizing transposase RayT
MNDPITYFITWTTYGTWLPGDARGWRKTRKGVQPPQPLLEAWCRDRMTENPVLLNETQRAKIEAVCREHAQVCGWILHAVSARSNHVHLAVTTDRKPQIVRDQCKANATRVLHQAPDAITNDKVWTRGGDCDIVDGEDELERAVEYILEAQDRMDRGK